MNAEGMGKFVIIEGLRKKHKILFLIAEVF